MNRLYILLAFFGLALLACNTGNNQQAKKEVLIKGLYTYGPELKSITRCVDGREFWVLDSAENLELQYSQFDFEKPYEPVYVELEGHLIKSDSVLISADFDSTFVVKKVLKISKEIPDGSCLQ